MHLIRVLLKNFAPREIKYNKINLFIYF